MFEALRKKIASWIGGPEKEDKENGKIDKKNKKNSKKAEVSISKEPEEQLKLEKTSRKAENLIKEPKSKGFFSRLFKKISGVKITKEIFNEIFQELEIILLENNVALEVVEKIRENLSKSLIGTEIKRAEIEDKITESLKNSILDVLIEPDNLIEKIKNKKDGPFVILFFGINGSGKTTSIAKIAHKLKKAGISCIMAAADTFRAASIEQLQTHGKNLNVEVISKAYGSDPASVAFDAIQQAKKQHANSSEDRAGEARELRLQK